MKKWIVAARFFQREDDVWLDDFIESKCVRFKKIPNRSTPVNWHLLKGARQDFVEWINCFK